MNKLFVAMLSGLLIATTVYSADTFVLKLVDQLDEPEFYCLDVAGWDAQALTSAGGASLR